MELNQSRIAFFIGGVVVLALVVMALLSQFDTLRQAIDYFHINRMIRM